MSVWRSLPFDGLGWGRCADRDVGRCRQWASARWYGRFPVVLRPVLFCANRIAWPIAALVRAARFARLRRLELRAFLSLYRDCLLTGADPVDAFVWRRLYRRAPLMSARSAALLVQELGSPDGQALLSDKQALAERLKAAGVCVPGTHTVRNPLCIEELARVIGPTGLVLKPRYGSGGRNVSAITRSGDRWQIDGLDVDAGRLSEHLTQLSAGHELIVQDRLVSADGLADLSWRGRAPVLRLATSRIPAGPPQLDSALLILPRPGFKPRNFLNGQIYAPIDPDTGMAKGGVVLESPDTMLDFRGGGWTSHLGQEGPVLCRSGSGRASGNVDCSCRSRDSLGYRPDTDGTSISGRQWQRELDHRKSGRSIWGAGQAARCNARSMAGNGGASTPPICSRNTAG